MPYAAGTSASGTTRTERTSSPTTLTRNQAYQRNRDGSTLGDRVAGQSVDRWVVRAPAKLNLYLAVLGKRADGFHELCSLMVAIDLYDTLVFRPASELAEPVQLRSNVAAVETGDNLVVRAIELLRKRCGVPPEPLRVWLQKRIPIGAGLGGGSSDGAATLLSIARRYGLAVSHAQLVSWSAELGSDCPFFAAECSAAVVRGRGEQLEPVPLPRQLDIVVHWPGVHVSTAQVFARVRPGRADQRQITALIDALQQEASVEAISRLLRNDLVDAACAIAPPIARSLSFMRDHGLAAAMTGSGSAVFGIAHNRQEAIHVGQQLRRHLRGFVTVVRNLG